MISSYVTMVMIIALLDTQSTQLQNHCIILFEADVLIVDRKRTVYIIL